MKRRGRFDTEAVPFWFGPKDRPLFGWLHLPASGQVRGSVVLCPPLAGEAIAAQRTFRLLAESIAAAGLAALRFDYDGTGDSAGCLDDPGRVTAWLGSVRVAVETARRACSGPTALVGMRAGATLAAEAAAADGAVDALVLWDPCATGQSFVREQRALRSLSAHGPSTSEGWTELPGFAFRPETVQDLAAVRIARTSGPLARRILVLTRFDRPRNRGLQDRLTMAHVDWEEAVGQAALLDVEPPQAVVPFASLRFVAGWLSNRFDGEAVAADVPASRPVTLTGDNGVPVVETPVRLGPLGLFGISTTPAHPLPERSGDRPPTVVLINVSTEDHTGPGRMWVEIARTWAGHGLPCLRFDLSGLGESPVRPGQPEHVGYAPEALDDIVDVAKAVSPDDPTNVVLVGLCSGAYTAIEGGIALGSKGVCAVNPILAFRPPELGPRSMDARRRACQPPRPLVRLLARGRPLYALNQNTQLPNALWAVINRVLLVGSPVTGLAKLVARGVDTLVFIGKDDLRMLAPGSSLQLRRLTRTGRFGLRVISDVDHSLLGRKQRLEVCSLLVDHVLGRFGPGEHGSGAWADSGHRQVS